MLFKHQILNQHVKRWLVSPTAATFYFYKSFWSVLRSQALETLQLSFRELNGRKSCWNWPGSAPKPPRPSNLTWLCTKTSQTFSRTFSGTLLNLTWLCTKTSQTFSGTFSGSLLNLTWLCTKASEPSSEPCSTWPDFAPKPPRPSPEPSPEPGWTWPGCTKASPTFSRNLLRKPVEPDLALHQSLGTFFGTLFNLTWLCTKASQTFSGTFSGTRLNLTWLHQSLPDLLPEPSPEPSPEPFSEPSPEPCWTWPGSAPKPPDLLRNLRNLLRNLVEPDPAPAPVHTGAILGWRPR